MLYKCFVFAGRTHVDIAGSLHKAVVQANTGRSPNVVLMLVPVFDVGSTFKHDCVNASFFPWWSSAAPLCCARPVPFTVICRWAAAKRQRCVNDWQPPRPVHHQPGSPAYVGATLLTWGLPGWTEGHAWGSAAPRRPTGPARMPNFYSRVWLVFCASAIGPFRLKHIGDWRVLSQRGQITASSSLLIQPYVVM